jgi:hypothetical protein
MTIKQDIYLNTCLKEIERLFGTHEAFIKNDYDGELFTDLVTPVDGSSAWCFFPHSLEWEDTEQLCMCWRVRGDGDVIVDYQDEPEYGAMRFTAIHPHEPVELLYLMTRPQDYWQNRKVEYENRPLGDLVTFELLAQASRPLREIPIESVTPHGDPELQADIYGNLIDDTNGMIEGRVCYGEAFAKQWREWLAGFQPAERLRAKGYLMGRTGHLWWAASLPHPAGNTILLAVGVKNNVSSLFLREYLHNDDSVQRQIIEAYVETSNLADLMDALKRVTCRIPREFLDQIRVAAEVNLMRTALDIKATWLHGGGKSLEDTIQFYADRIKQLDQLLSDNAIEE